MSLSRQILNVLSVALIVLGTSAVFGQDYPNKPIRILTTGAGGGSDFAARLIGQAISVPLGQPMVVGNYPPLIASEMASKAPPDGYTLYVGAGSLWILPLLQKTPFEASDFSPISILTRDVAVLAVHPSMPAKSVKELVSLAKARPGALDYGSGTSGTSSHLAGELFRSMADVNLVRVPFKSSVLAVTALISGEIQVMIIEANQAAPQMKAGKLRALGVTSAQPSTLYPELPTVAAAVPGYEYGGMTGMWFPAKTPAAIVTRFNQEVVRFLKTADAKEKFSNIGSEIVASSPEEAAAIIKADAGRMGKVIKDRGIKAE